MRACETSRKSRLTAAMAPLVLLLAGFGEPAPEPRAPAVERPADIWQYLQDAAAAAGAAPDRLVTYTGVAGQTHRIEIFLPNGNVAAEAPYPGLVLFHGGAWREGAPIQFYRQARVIADAGFVVALPEYSLLNEDQTTPRDAVADAFRAWEMIRSVTADLGVAPDRLFAGGASAGGHMAAGLATLAPPSAMSDHAPPAGLILFNPVLDNGPDGYGYARVQDYWEAFSPLHNIGPTHPDTLILVGDSDALLPVDTAQRYCEAVRATAASCDVQVFPNAGHAWFNYDPAGYAATLAAALTILQTWGK